MTAKQILDSFSETLMRDERILSPQERELLMSLLQNSRAVSSSDPTDSVGCNRSHCARGGRNGSTAGVHAVGQQHCAANPGALGNARGNRGDNARYRGAGRRTAAAEPYSPAWTEGAAAAKPCSGTRPEGAAAAEPCTGARPEGAAAAEPGIAAEGTATSERTAPATRSAAFECAGAVGSGPGQFGRQRGRFGFAGDGSGAVRRAG